MKREPADRPARVVTIRPTTSSIRGRHGHVVWIESHDESSSSQLDFTIEGGIVFVLIFVADIVLLATSGHFSAVPRELIRWVGGAFVVLVVAIAALVIVFSGAMTLLLGSLDSHLTGRRRSIPVSARFSVGILGLCFGALAGTSVVLDGPVDFAVVAGFLWIAARIGLGNRVPGRSRAVRHLVAAGLVIAAATAGVVGYLLLNHA